MLTKVDPSAPTTTSVSLLEAVVRAQTQVAAALPDADAVMRLVVRHAMAMTGATGASIALRDGDEVVYPVNEGFTASWERTRFPLTGTLSGLCLLSGELLFLDDLEASSHPQSQVARMAGIRSFLAVPLWHEGRVVAALSVASPDEHAFGEETALVLQLLVGMAGSALAHAEAFAALRIAKEEAERARTEAADFSGMVAHELGSPIAAIRHAAELLGMGQLDALQARAHSLIETEVRTLGLLVADLQAIATMQSDTFSVRVRPVAVTTLLDDAVAIARTLPGDHPIVLDAEGQPEVMVDPDRIGQVLRNLLSNAAKYSPPGTPITLRMRSDHRQVCIEVVDQGDGIASDELEQIFAKFQRGRQAHGEKRGLGLGLYLSQRIAQAHGGELKVHSTPGAGSVFSLTLEVIA